MCNLSQCAADSSISLAISVVSRMHESADMSRYRRSLTRKTVCFTVVLTSLARLSGQHILAQDQPTPSPAHALVEQALSQIENGQWDQAILTAEKGIALDAEHADSRVVRGMAFNGKSEYDKAIEDFDWVTEKQGRDPEIVQSRADAYAHRSFALYQKKQYLDAINSAYFATLERGDHFEAHNFRTMAYLARKQYDKAINSANRAIRDKEDFAEAYSNRGYAYGAKGNANQALADQVKAIELDGTLAIAWQRRGAAYGAKGDLEKAKADLDKALQLQPDLVAALCDRAFLFGMARDIPNAMADLDKAIQLDPNFTKAHVRRGQALLDLGQFDDAIVSLSRAIDLDPENAMAFCYRGYAYHSDEDHSDAVKDFSKAIELNPDFTNAYKGRRQAYLKLGKRTEAGADSRMVRQLTTPPEQQQEESPRFTVESKPVDPVRLGDALSAAKKLDAFVAANYTKHKVNPNPAATDAQFLRRIYLDVTGTIPTYRQVRSFLISKDPEKRTKLIDELLNSDGYASHYFNYWADVLRYTDSLNTNVRGEHYRQWLKESLAANKPWDKCVHEMMTAEGLVWENPATGYLQRDANMPLDNMNNTVRIFLGTRIGCAQCHDHPFDRWTQKEFYQMAAFTYGTLTRTGGHDTRYWADNPSERLQMEYEEIEQEEEDRRRNSYRFNRMVGYNMQIVNDQTSRKIKLPADYAYDNAKAGEVIEPKTLFGKPAKLRSGQPPRHAFAEWLTSKDNPRFALTIANRLWKQAFGVGQIEPVDDMMDSTVAENPELMAFLESEMLRLNFDTKQYLRMIFNSQSYQREACTAEVHPGEPYHFPGPILRRMTAEQIWDSFLTLAVVDPEEYRELPANVRTDIIGVDLTKAKAPEVLQALTDEGKINGGKWQREKKYHYKGNLLARASELPSPVPANHFLRTFGQSNRELISASSTTGNVPQVLFMFNGPISHMMLEKDSTMYRNVMKARSVPSGITAVFRTVLSRDPVKEEMDLAMQEVKANGAAGYGNVIWSLVNTREFLFIQ